MEQITKKQKMMYKQTQSLKNTTMKPKRKFFYCLKLTFLTALVVIATATPGVSFAAKTVTGITYSGNIETISYSDGTKISNTATSSLVKWAADHITKTTTYTFANGGTNPVVTIVPGTAGTPVLTGAVYPSNWTTIGTVIAPSLSSVATTYGDGYVSTEQDGTSSKPFLQTTLATLPTPVTDPNATVSSSTTSYDLRWGTPDKNGIAYAAFFSNGAVNKVTLPYALNIWANTIGGQITTGPTIATPHPDVISAWQSGWTGSGVNILMEDALTTSNGLPTHAVTTAMLALRYAPGSTIYGYNNTTGLGIYNLNGTKANPTGIINIGVVNASWGENIWSYVGHTAPFSSAELQYAFNSFYSTGLIQSALSRYTGATTFSNFNYTSAVIVKSAGNDAVEASLDGFGYALAHTSSVNNRLLLVGALNSSGSVNSKTYLASYSNMAGTDPLVQNRFLVASGTTPFSTGDISVNGVPLSATTVDPATGITLGNSGTSYAAPRVAGYVAILRSKFPNLDAIKTSSIMLDTARYDTLTCYPSCDPAIYGKGEASLSRALAPVGRLR